jgi:AraC-like DNA-binding protein
VPPVDRLSSLLERFRVRTQLFHDGPLCGRTEFPAGRGHGFLHVLRRGSMDVTYPSGDGISRSIRVEQPSLLFFPRPIDHVFHNPPTDESDFACAELDFDGGATHPLVRTLPDVVVLPLADIATLQPALDLLFAEVDNVRCGKRLLADRLFEVVLIQLMRWMLDHADDLGLPQGLLSGLSDERLAPTLVALHDEPGADWNLARMAQRANMSRSVFAARFKEVVGQPPGDYLTDWRLTIAQQQLVTGRSVGEVAAELGYASASAFSRVFAQRVGDPPREWATTRRLSDAR